MRRGVGDQILTLEGKPQQYGTQFDWDDDGELNPLPIADPQDVDVRRRAAGLDPLAEELERICSSIRDNGEQPKEDLSRTDLWGPGGENPPGYPTLAQLAVVDPHADEATLIGQIAELERVKSAAAGQARAAAALDEKRRADEAAAGGVGR